MRGPCSGPGHDKNRCCYIKDGVCMPWIESKLCTGWPVTWCMMLVCYIMNSKRCLCVVNVWAMILTILKYLKSTHEPCTSHWFWSLCVWPGARLLLTELSSACFSLAFTSFSQEDMADFVLSFVPSNSRPSCRMSIISAFTHRYAYAGWFICHLSAIARKHSAHGHTQLPYARFLIQSTPWVIPQSLTIFF